MSTLKVNTVLSADTPTVNITDGINVTGVSTVTTLNTTNLINATQLSHRNLIINGAMQVAQRATSYSGSSASTGYHTLDRFSVEEGGVDESGTKEQAAVTSGGAYDSGFRNCLKITNGNQTGGAGASDYVQIMQRIEAQNIANSGWNYLSSSSFITLSFWVKSSVAQVFSGSLRTADGTSYSYKFDTPSLSANTWTKVTKTIPGNSNLQFDDDNETGLSLYLYPFLGTTYTSSNANTETWITAATTTYSNNMTSTWYTTNDATFETTGWQFEVGSVATPFEFRSYGDELAHCQRYFYMHANGSVDGNSGNCALSDNATAYNGTTCFFSVPFPVTMRSKPSLIASNGSGDYGYYVNGGSLTGFDTISLDGVTTRTVGNVNFSGSFSGGQAVLVRTKTSDATMAFSAEL